MKKTILKLAAASAGGLLFAGCISCDETVTRETKRVKVQFENEAAARIFYEALSKAPGYENRSETTTKFEIPVLFHHTRHVVSGSSAAFNRAVERCDTNRDGWITELEAKIYAGNVAK